MGGYFRKQHSRLMDGFLPLEDEDERIAKLVELCQPRLNSMLVTAGKELCDQEVVQTQNTRESIEKLVKLMQCGLNSEGAERVAKAAENLKSVEQKIAESKGYKDSVEMREHIAVGTTIAGATVAGGIAIVCGVAEVAVVGGAVVAASATGVGLVLLVAGGICASSLHKQNQELQQEMDAKKATRTRFRGSLKTEEEISDKIEQVFVDSLEQLGELQEATDAVSKAYNAQSVAMANFSVEASRLLRS